MLFTYKAVTKEGQRTTGDINAQGKDAAVGTLQRGELLVISVDPAGEKNIFNINFDFFNRVSAKEIAVISRQIATLLGAFVPALKTFRLLSDESEKPIISRKFTEISDDIKNGVAISDALFKHPEIFSDFYVNMVRGGEESGKLAETFLVLADHIERSYEIMSKARGALIYPIFVVSTFIVVMILMLTMVIPKLASIITESGQVVPIYTKVVIGVSYFLVNYGLFLFLGVVAGGYYTWKYLHNTDFIEHAKLWAPGIGNLYRMIYLSRITDNMHTMLTNGISMLRSLEITANVVDNDTYKKIIIEASVKVKGGVPLSIALSNYPEIPNLMIQMVKVGEETGELGSILEKLAVFYRREVDNAIATVVSMIEPVMIVSLGVGVGGVLASVLLPIYEIAGGI